MKQRLPQMLNRALRRPANPGFVALLLLAGGAFAQESPENLARCASIVDDTHRLSCFDRLAASVRPPPEQQLERLPQQQLAHQPEQETEQQPERAESEPLGTEIAVSPPADTTESLLARHWETEPRYKLGSFRFRPHRDNYILFAKYDDNPNTAPFDPFRSLNPEQEGLSRTELAFQFGFKMKLAENLLYRNADLWFGYTQQSFWQAYNPGASSPFRETNYQPEVMLVMPLNFSLLGLQGRFVNIGFNHQSNGQSSTLSRSWNRLYLQAGWERGDFSLLTRIWTRVDEGDTPDDNPDIIDYMGHGDIVATWRKNGHQVSLLGRQNFNTGKGALQLGWAFPVVSRLKGYVQVFSGYGQSLIDYNSHQNTVGFGVLLDY